MNYDLKNSTLYEEKFCWKEKQSNSRFISFLLVLAALFFSLRFYWTNNFGGVTVDGGSMNYTLLSGQQLIMRYTKEGEGVKRGDIIVVEVDHYPEVQEYNKRLPPDQPLEFLIKRLIATEGDKVKCLAGQVYVCYAGTEEYVALDEPYAYYNSSIGKANYNFGPYELAEGEIFFLGDNRTNSTDSRYMEGGSHLDNRLYKQTDIIGVVPQWAVDNMATLEKIFFRK